MLKTILRLYTTAMAEGVRSPIPHLFGPPGCGKSSTVQEAADALGVKLHIINVSRLSPLEIEGIQMPDQGKLSMLLSSMWNNLEDGDIVLWDEFLACSFPEVFNGLLDILTSRQVAGHTLPNVFMIAASNTTVAYSPALADRLLHLPVADPRSNTAAYNHLRTRLLDELLPANIDKVEYLETTPDVVSRIDQLFESVIFPGYSILDSFTQGQMINSSSVEQSLSLRNMIGQIKLRFVQTKELSRVIRAINVEFEEGNQPENVRLFVENDRVKGVADMPAYLKQAAVLLDHDSLTVAQQKNLVLNLNLLQSEGYVL